ncbi:ArdC family protein [Psychrobacter sp. AOP31-A1-22]|uniref:ArdC family protein n=1 Tax=Psychrobacter sp. AOP31-A1-22 TaxID=3457696 RepID=UPI00403607FF
MAKSTKRDLHQEVTDKILARIEQGNFKSCELWSKKACVGSQASALLPVNATTGKAYNGINRLILFLEMAVNDDYSENLWVTYNQAKKEGWQVRKGQKSVTLCFYSKYTKEDKNGDEKDIFFMKSFNVFNVAQLDGYEAKDVTNNNVITTIDNNEVMAEILQNTDVTILPEGGDQAFYAPAFDAIQMPPRKAFISEATYTSVLSHELSHATGHTKRLNRQYREIYGSKEGYAREELVAELSAAFLSTELGYIQETLEFHASYLNSWAEVLRKDKKAIFKACADAQKATDFILENWAKIEKINEVAA